MKTFKMTKTSIKRKPTETGESVEEIVRKAIATKAPIDGGAQLIFTPASDGVRPEFDIRTDKQDLALMANDKYQASDEMKGFIKQIEYDKKGTDGAGNKKPEKVDDNG